MLPRLLLQMIDWIWDRRSQLDDEHENEIRGLKPQTELGIVVCTLFRDEGGWILGAFPETYLSHIILDHPPCFPIRPPYFGSVLLEY